MPKYSINPECSIYLGIFKIMLFSMCILRSLCEYFNLYASSIIFISMLQSLCFSLCVFYYFYGLKLFTWTAFSCSTATLSIWVSVTSVKSDWPSPQEYARSSRTLFDILKSRRPLSFRTYGKICWVTMQFEMSSWRSVSRAPERKRNIFLVWWESLTNLTNDNNRLCFIT